MNRFVLNETSYHGSGAIYAIPDEIKGRGLTKILVASDPDLVKFGVTQKVTILSLILRLRTFSQVLNFIRNTVQTESSQSAEVHLWILQKLSESS